MITFHKLVDTFADSPTDDVMDRLVGFVEQKSPTDEDLAHLALRMAESGEMLHDWGATSRADIPSTGGPSSLSTLLCPLYLKALGYIVPKLGVPGRPAGGIDVLSQIPGYKIEFTNTEVEKLLRKSGYVNFNASKTFTPLDAILFSYRKQRNKISIPELAIASLLSKKKAAAVSLVGLDVRVASHGNFGSSFATAEQYAKRFCRVGSIIGLRSCCFLSDASSPYQPFIGRGEALIAISQIIKGKTDSWLSAHNDACYWMANRLSQLDTGNKDIARPRGDVLLSVFRENLKIQGASFENFNDYVQKINKKHKLYLKAQKNGFLYINLELLRSLIVRIQGYFQTPEILFPDPCGIILKFNSGTYVQKGEILATIRCTEKLDNEILKGAADALQVMQEPISGLHFKEVSYA